MKNANMAIKSSLIYRYRVRNWPEYNRALVRRGSLTFRVDEQALRGGRLRFCADKAIECALVVKTAFHPSSTATRGFRESLVRLTGVALPVPDGTTVCRRQYDLGLSWAVRKKQNV